MNLKKKTIHEVIKCDTDRLYAPLPEAIKYLQEVQQRFPDTNIELEEHWFDYETMELQFTYTRVETDAEYNARLDALKEQATLEKEARQKAVEAERKKLDEQIQTLKNKRDSL